MNQYGNQSIQDSRKRPLPRFDPRDNMLLRELIDKRPSLKDVNGDPKLLSELWGDLTVEYNKTATQYRGVATLRRKFKGIRDTIKKRLKDEAKKDDLLAKRPRLDLLDSFNNSRGRQLNLAMTSLSSLPVAGISSTMGMNLGGPATGINFRNNSYGGSQSSDMTMSYDRPQRSTYSPPPTRDSFANDCQSSSNNNDRESNHRNYSGDEFDPFDPFEASEERQSYCEEESFRKQDNGNTSDHTAPVLDYEVSQLHRNKLDVEIACVKTEHQRSMMRMRRYHDLKMQEVNMAIQHMKSKHSLECDYLRLKIKQVQAAIERDAQGSIDEMNHSVSQTENGRVLGGKQTVDMTQMDENGGRGVSKKVLDSEMELFLANTGLKDDGEIDDAEQTERNAMSEVV